MSAIDKENEAFGKDEFHQLFMDNYEAIRNFIHYKIGDMQASEDIAQDVFIKVWDKRDEIISSKSKYLCYTIANNLSLNYIKHLKIVFNFRNAFVEKNEFETPEHIIEQKEFDDRLQKALASLSEKQRVVFLMNRIDKLTYNEIAERLGLSVKAIEKRMSQALKELNNLVGVKL